MKKRLTIIAAMLLVLAGVSGCTKGSYTFIYSNENSGTDFWNVSYGKFNGYKEREITISAEGKHVFTVDIVTNSGKLSLSIKDSNGTSLYRGNDMPSSSSSFTVAGDGEGKYVIRFDADNHSGSFNIKWE